jgi:hypothetical protein
MPERGGDQTSERAQDLPSTRVISTTYNRLRRPPRATGTVRWRAAHSSNPRRLDYVVTLWPAQLRTSSRRRPTVINSPAISAASRTTASAARAAAAVRPPPSGATTLAAGPGCRRRRLCALLRSHHGHRAAAAAALFLLFEHLVWQGRGRGRPRVLGWGRTRPGRPPPAGGCMSTLDQRPRPRRRRAGARRRTQTITGDSEPSTQAWAPTRKLPPRVPSLADANRNGAFLTGRCRGALLGDMAPAL